MTPLAVALAVLPLPFQTAPDAAAPPVSDETRAEVEALLADIQAGLAGDDSQLLLDRMDFGAMGDAGRALVDLGADVEPLAMIGLRIGMADAMLRTDPWTSFEVLSIEQSDEGLEVVFRARGELADTFQRYWLHEDAVGWRVRDLEDLDIGLRASVALSAGLAATVDGATSELRAFGEAIRAIPALVAEEDFTGLEDALSGYTPDALPIEFQAVHWVLYGSAMLGQGYFEDALDAMDRADAARPGMPLVDFARGACWVELGEPERGLAHARAYVDALVPHADALELIGRALHGLGRLDEAADAFRRGLADDPDNLDNLVGLARVLPADGDAEVRAAFAAVDDGRLAFDAIAQELLATDHDDDVQALVEELARLAPEDPNVAYYGAMVRIRRGDHAGAADVLAGVLPRVADSDELRYYLDLHAEACVGTGSPLAALEASPDPGYTFDILGEELAYQGDAAALHALVDAHRAASPDDPWLEYYAGWAFEIEDDLEAAEAAYRAGFERFRDAPEDDERRKAYAWEEVRALFRVGRGLEAYERVTPSVDTFEQLADLALEERDAELLLALVERRRADDGSDGRLPLLEGCARFYRGDLERALEILDEAVAYVPADDYWTVYSDEALVLAALRLGRHGRALADARRVTGLGGSRRLEAIVYGVRGEEGDPERAVEAIEDCLALGHFDPQEFYDDPDLGPVLLGEPYAAFRATYPPAAGD